MASRFIVGIDLGTTNTALAYMDTRDESATPQIHTFEIPQVVRAGAAEPRPLLPSSVYLPAQGELPDGSLSLPWDANPASTVGEFARGRGKEVPGRLVSSSKSWLCHPGVDRRGPILPWNAPPEVAKISPVEASARILKHLAGAWDGSVGWESESDKLGKQQILLCCPASFDAAAKDLTLEAARLAGFEDVTLLEEPQSAFYAWIAQAGEKWRDLVKTGDLIFVVDVGGGTTDFSLIAVGEEGGNLTLNRVAVGEHILLGGDNMDLALAHAVAARMAASGTKLDAWQIRGLAHGCREAKETLLADAQREEHPLAILGRGSKLIGGTIRTKITRDEVSRMILDGFFGSCPQSERPKRAMRLGLQELGLSYAADPSISKHMARFLARENHTGRDFPAQVRGEAFVHPTAVLFNGGVMKADALRNRVVGQLNDWIISENGEQLRVLPGADLDQAVARGAAFYGLALRGKGIRIRGGVPRSYYIGVESSMPAVPGFPPPIKALCVVPYGMEEGTEADVPGAEFGLVTGEPVQFRFLSSTTRRDETMGNSVEDWESSIEELAPIEANLPATGGTAAGMLVPVRLHTKITTVGTLELWCLESGGNGQWKLELNVRE